MMPDGNPAEEINRSGGREKEKEKGRRVKAQKTEKIVRPSYTWESFSPNSSPGKGISPDPEDSPK
jgi:hypothetical protein